MNQFTIEPNSFLKISIDGFHHDRYYGGGGRWREDGTIENIICTLKNDITPFPQPVLQKAVERLSSILENDLPEVLRITRLNNPVVCVVPRAKAQYRKEQLLFKDTVRDVTNRLGGFIDGTDFILRHTDTKTTHRDRSGHGGTGELPYPGITLKTCTVSKEVKGKDILLIDDLYTKTVNIDEDAIQALLDRDALRVIFYSIGRTV